MTCKPPSRTPTDVVAIIVTGGKRRLVSHRHELSRVERRRNGEEFPWWDSGTDHFVYRATIEYPGGTRLEYCDDLFAPDGQPKRRKSAPQDATQATTARKASDQSKQRVLEAMG